MLRAGVRRIGAESFLVAVCVVLQLCSGSNLLAAEPQPGTGVSRPAQTPLKASAPFDARQARVYQEAWARHLGIPLESRNSVGGKMRLIPPGEFQMGSSDQEILIALRLADTIKADANTKTRISDSEWPQHPVKITQPLLFGVTEVTIGQFRQFVEATKYVTEAEKYGTANTDKTVVATTPQKEAFDWRFPGYKQTEDDAVSQVTWNDAVVFCNWLSVREQLSPCYALDKDHGWTLRREGTGYRFPTEAEWEYACRAGTTGQYSFGNDFKDLDKHAWFYFKSGSKPVRAVGSKLPNPFGLSDMHGNVCEWCQDGYDPQWYSKSPTIDPRAPDGPKRVMRGGDWFGNGVRCRSAFRGIGGQSTRSDDVGFRLMRQLPQRSH